MDASLSSLRSLTDVVLIQSALEELTRAEVSVDDALDQLQAQRSTITKHLTQLDALRPKLSVLLGDVGHVATTISSTSKLAERTSEKVRQLDVEQSYVQQAIRQVEDIMEFKTCVLGLQNAMTSKAYESAAANVHRYLTFDPKIVDIVFSETQDGVDEREILRSAEAELKEVVNREFDAAVQARNDEAIVRFFKLFPLLKQAEQGLSKYGAYLTSLVSSQIEAELQGVRPAPATASTPSSQQPSALTPFIDVLTHLYEQLANIIDSQEPIIETHYSPGQVLPILERLQKEGDRLGALILKSFTETAGLSKKLQAMSRSNPAAGISMPSAMTSLIGGASKPEVKAPELDLKEVDRMLHDIVVVSQRTTLFFRFMTDRLKIQFDLLPKAGPGVTLSAVQQRLQSQGVDGWIRGTGLYRARQEIMAQYVTLEEHFLRKSVEKAMKMDERDQGSLTSSSLDDTFFIFKKCVTRAVSSADLDTICAVVNLVGRCLEADFVDGLKAKLQRTFTSLDPKDREQKISCMVILNNIDVACDYASKLRSELAETVPRSLESLSPTQTQQLESCLGMLVDPVDGFQSALETATTTLFEKAWRPDLTTTVKDVFRELRLVPTEEEYETWRASNDLHMSSLFITEFDKSCKLYKSNLTDNNYNRLMQIVITFFVRDLEKTILRSQFNSFGAYALDSDLRALSSYFSNSTQWSTRDKFTRLSQMSTLLNLDKVSEIYDYWGSKAGALTWRLSIAEVRQVLALRADFSSDEINRLKL